MLGYVASRIPNDSGLLAVVRGARRPVQMVSLPFVPKRYKKA